MSTAIRIAAPALAAALALAGAAQAQPAAPPSGQSGGQHAGRNWDPAQHQARRQAHRQERLQTLHDALGLRPDQETAWQAFAADSQPAGEERERWRGRDADEASAPLTTPQRLDRMTQRLGEMKARLDRRAASVKRFYAVLDPRQQKTFDALFSLRQHDHAHTRERG
jgi:hypothetical protein